MSSRVAATYWIALAAGCLLAAAAVPARADDDVHVLAWGDSLTAGGDWLNHLPALGHGSWTWEDHGSAGERSWEAADVIVDGAGDRRFRDWLESEYVSGPHDVFVFLWGTNDVRQTDWKTTGSPPGTRNNLSTRQALAQIVDDALATGAPVLLAVPPPFAAGPGSNHTAEQVALYNQNLEILRTTTSNLVTIRRLQGRPIAWVSVYDHWLALPGWPSLDYYRLPDGDADGVHPGREPGPSGFAGRFHVAEALAPAIEEAASLRQAPSVPALPAPYGIALAGMLACVARRFVPARDRRYPLRPT